jgi:penicillin-binding protein 1A
MHERLAAIRTALGHAITRLTGSPPVALLRRHPIRVGAALAATTIIIAGTWTFSCGLAGCPTVAALRAFRPTEGGRVLDRHGVPLGHLTPVRRVNVPLARIPRNVQLAFIAVEDRRFYQHHGVDWHGTVRAAWANTRHLELREGSSTLTMQAARSAFLTSYEGERSVRRKLIELELTRRLEGALTKAQILELYLNAIYLGDGTYGVEAASRHYFGKPVARVTLAEAALLAALPRAPSVYDPRRHPERALARRNLILDLMATQHLVSTDAASRARAMPIEVADDGWQPEETPSDALDLVRATIDSLARGGTWQRGELVVRTTFDVPAQRAAARAVRDRVAALRRDHPGDDHDLTGAMVALDPASGDLRAIVGAADYQAGGFNRALRAKRQPGSAFKPFLYAAAMEHGLTPATVVDDVPVRIVQAGGAWEPANYGDAYEGLVTVRHAVAQSLNSAAVHVSQQVGLSAVIDVARRAGITSPLRPVPSLALGSEEVTPLELVAAYAAFGNGGWRVTPTFLLSVTTTTGDTLYARTAPNRTMALDRRDAFLVTSLLRSVVDEGTGRAIRDLGVTVPVAGKTGTTNDGSDVWFVGYTQTLVAGFWFGHDAPRSLGPGATGGRLAAPAWASFYRRGWDSSRDEPEWAAPVGVHQVSIERATGRLADDGCGDTREEWFKAGTEPRERCEGDGPVPWVADRMGGGRDVGDEIRRALLRAFGRMHLEHTRRRHAAPPNDDGDADR